jgi:hypothetical protein
VVLCVGTVVEALIDCTARRASARQGLINARGTEPGLQAN